MKKLLVIAFVSLFAVSAFAAEVKIGGVYEIEGRYFQNKDQAVDGRSSSYYKHLARFWVYAAIDPKLDVTARVTVADGPLGRSMIGDWDRAWATYKPLDGLKVEAGRYTGGIHSVNGFGNDFYKGVGYMNGSGGRNGIRVTYDLNDSVRFFALTEKLYESQRNKYQDNTVTTDGDFDSYLIGADIKLGDLGIHPRAGMAVNNRKNYAVTTAPRYANVLAPDNKTDNAEVYGGYIGVTYLPATGLNIQGVVAFISSSSDDNDYDYDVFGAMADVSFVTDFFYVGGIVAYGSQDDNQAFNFGGDWDKTALIDDWFNDSNDQGVGGFLAFYLYGGVNVTSKISIDGVVAYYMMIDDKYSYITEDRGVSKNQDDTKMLEVDLTAKYQWTDATSFTVGAAYAMMNDVDYRTPVTGTAGPIDDADPIYRLWWHAKTTF